MPTGVPLEREVTCPICKKRYLKNIRPSDILINKRTVCSKECSLIRRKRAGKIVQKKNRKGNFKKCKWCHCRFYSARNRNQYYCSQWCYFTAIHKRSSEREGYVTLHNGKREHRYIMELRLGRKLKPNEAVHHINHNKKDNRIENLVVLSRSEHGRLHAVENEFWRYRKNFRRRGRRGRALPTQL